MRSAVEPAGLELGAPALAVAPAELVEIPPGNAGWPGREAGSRRADATAEGRAPSGGADSTDWGVAAVSPAGAAATVAAAAGTRARRWAVAAAVELCDRARCLHAND